MAVFFFPAAKDKISSPAKYTAAKCKLLYFSMYNIKHTKKDKAGQNTPPYIHYLIISVPIYGTSASGIVTEPSAFW